MILLLFLEIISVADWRLQNCNHARMGCNNDVILLLFIIATQTRTCQWKWVVILIAIGALVWEPWQNLEQWHPPAVDHTTFSKQTCFSAFPSQITTSKFSSFNGLFFPFFLSNSKTFFCFDSFSVCFQWLGRYGDARRLNSDALALSLFMAREKIEYCEGNFTLLSNF